MPINRRTALAMTGAMIAAPLISQTTVLAGKSTINENGLHTQPWFKDTFLDLREDLAEAASAGKRLAIFWEQRGCPYCAKMHETNLADPEIAAYIKKHFFVVQLNFRGAREVTDFDGKKMEERKLARRWRVNFTPTISFLPASLAQIGSKVGREAESWRLLGYWKPFHFLATFTYVREGGPETDPSFQHWLDKYADKLRAQGKVVKIW